MYYIVGFGSGLKLPSVRIGYSHYGCGAVAPSRQRPVTRTGTVRLLAGTDAGEDLLLQLASQVATSIHASCPNGDEINTSHSMPTVG